MYLNGGYIRTPGLLARLSTRSRPVCSQPLHKTREQELGYRARPNGKLPVGPLCCESLEKLAVASSQLESNDAAPSQWIRAVSQGQRLAASPSFAATNSK